MSVMHEIDFQTSPLENNRSSEASSQLFFTMMGVSLLYLAILQFHGFFCHLLGDERLQVVIMRENGLIDFISFYYNNRDGRFASFFQFYWLLKINRIFPIIYFGVALNAILTISTLYYFQKLFLLEESIKDSAQSRALLGICIIETAILFMIIPNKGELLYWLVGYPVYMVPFYFLLMSLMLGSRYQKQGGGLIYLLAIAIFSFIAGGCSEVYGTMVIGLSMVFLSVKIALARSFFKNSWMGSVLETMHMIFQKIIALPYSVYATLILFHALSFLLVVLSPGHANRKASIGLDDVSFLTGFQDLIVNTLAEVTKPKLLMIPVLGLLVAILIHRHIDRKASPQSRRTVNAPIVFFLIIVLNVSLLLVMNTISIVSMGKPLTIRAYVPVVFLLYLLTIPGLLAVVRQRDYLLILNGKKYFPQKSVAKICLILFLGFHVLHILFQIDLIPETLHHHQARLHREVILKHPPTGDGPIVVPILPKSTMHRQKPISPDPETGINKTLAKYYGLDRPVIPGELAEPKTETAKELLIRAIKNRILL